MDQLPTVVGATSQPLDVPCVCDPWYFDGSQFEQFPARKGFKVIETSPSYAQYILNADATKLSPEVFAKIIQAWLFIGLLIEILKDSGVVIDVEDFIEHKGQERHVTTKFLPDYLSRWKQRESTLPRKERKAHYQRQQDLIGRSLYFREHQLYGRVWLEDLARKI